MLWLVSTKWQPIHSPFLSNRSKYYSNIQFHVTVNAVVLYCYAGRGSSIYLPYGDHVGWALHAHHREGYGGVCRRISTRGDGNASSDRLPFPGEHIIFKPRFYLWIVLWIMLQMTASQKIYISNNLHILSWCIMIHTEMQITIQRGNTSF